jgi:Holliday junction DNA helicase RuvA
MIVQLRGKIISKQPPSLVLDVNGVGYEVDAPMSTFYQLGKEETEVCILTHMVVREDAQLLYGFATEQERALFKMLIKINGVGPKLGIGILSGIESQDFYQTITNGDEARVVKIPGIGKKTAQRLIVELRDKIPKDILITTSSTTSTSINSSMQEALSALVALGYKANDAQKMVKLVSDQATTTEGLIRLALKSAMNK